MASRFWVGGTGTWDASTTTHWAATTGGAGGQTVPGSADTVTFDGASGGGTVTVNTTVNVLGITGGAFTGTLDFSANNNNVTIGGSSFNYSGTATRGLNLGNGTWTISSGSGTPWTIATTTGLTFNANSSIISLSSAANIRTFAGGGLSYSTISIAAATVGGGWNLTGANTIATLNITAPGTVGFSATTTITNAFTWSGSSGSELSLNSGQTGQQIISSANNGNITWAAITSLKFQGGGTFAATNSFDLQNNSGITITAPSGGGMQSRNQMIGNVG